MYVIIIGRERKPMELSVMDFDEANNFLGWPNDVGMGLEDFN